MSPLLYVQCTLKLLRGVYSNTSLSQPVGSNAAPTSGPDVNRIVADMVLLYDLTWCMYSVEAKWFKGCQSVHFVIINKHPKSVRANSFGALNFTGVHAFVAHIIYISIGSRMNASAIRVDTSDVLKVLKINIVRALRRVLFENFQNITSDHESRNAWAVHIIFCL